MNVLLGVNSRELEVYIASLKDVNVLKVLKNSRTLYNDVINLNPHVVILSRNLPSKQSIEDIIIKLRVEQPTTRIIYLYGEDDNVRKKFTNFLITNGIYDFFVCKPNECIDDDIIQELLYSPKTVNDVTLEDISETEQAEIEEALQKQETIKEQLRESIKEEIITQDNAPILSEDEMEDEVEAKVVERIVKEIEVQIIERVEEKEVIKIQTETVYRTTVIKQKVISVLSLQSKTAKDTVAANLAYILSRNTQQKILIMDFDAPFPALDHYFKIDKHIYINELYSGKQLTGLSGCLNGASKGILSPSTFGQYLKEINKNLFVLTGLYDLDIFEQLDSQIDDINLIIDIAKHNFDTIIITMNSFISSVLTYSAIMRSDKVIMVTEPTYEASRDTLAFINDYHNHQKLNIDTFEVLLLGNLLDGVSTQKIFEGYKMLGNIPYNYNSTVLALQQKTLPIKKANKKELAAYMKILSYFGFVPKRSFFERLFNKNTTAEQEGE